MNINPHSLSFPAVAGASGESNAATTEGRAGEIATNVVFDTADKVAISVPGAEASEKNNNEEKEKEQKKSRTDGIDDEDLSESEKREVEELERRDKEVKQHEAAHLAAAGRFATSAPHYEWQLGPDGEKYAVGGEVGIDTAKVQNDPEATIRKMEQVKRAAMAPASPSGQDYRVAAKAESTANRARAELAKEKDKEEDSVTEKKDPFTPKTEEYTRKSQQAAAYYAQAADQPRASLNIAA